MKPILHHCDHCCETLANDFTYPILTTRHESYIFCDLDCKNEFIDEMSKEIFIDIKGRWIED
ncbi:hypothetical protein UT300012_31770 [Paraclostridium bifermentans]